MKYSISITGADELRRKMSDVAEVAVAGSLTRRGLSDAARIITRAQKNLAPVRRGRVSTRKLDRLLKNGMPIGKATRLATTKAKTRQRKSRDAEFVGPGRAIKPGLMKRSIGYRVLKVGNYFVVKMGMNVGKKRSHNNFAPHAAFIGGTVQRYINGKLTGDEYGPKRGATRGKMPRNTFITDATNFAASSALAALEKAVAQDTVLAFKQSLRASRVGV